MNSKTEKELRTKASAIARDWNKYCNFFGGRNLETKEEFENDDLQERENYLFDILKTDYLMKN
jgi:hypothetical protein